MAKAVMTAEDSRRGLGDNKSVVETEDERVMMRTNTEEEEEGARGQRQTNAR